MFKRKRFYAQLIVLLLTIAVSIYEIIYFSLDIVKYAGTDVNINSDIAGICCFSFIVGIALVLIGILIGIEIRRKYYILKK